MAIHSDTQRWTASRRRRARWVALGAAALLLGTAALGVAQAQQTAGPVLEAVDVSTLSGNRVQLRFRFSEPVPEPRNFTINQPARVVLDFIGARSGLTTRQQDIGTGVAERINVLEGGDRTRASINLARLVPYTVRTEANQVLLTLESATPAPAVSPTIASQMAAPPPTTADMVQVTSIDFRRSAQGGAIIGILLSHPNVAVDVREEGTAIIADFGGAMLPREQERRLDVTDFATPVTTVDALNRPDGARIAVTPTGRYEYLVYQTDRLYTIEVRPVQPEEEEEDPLDPLQRRYTGELLSLNFQDIEVRAVLQIIADFTGLNVVVSDSVTGNLTLRLQNVPWDQALDIILTTKGLSSRQSGNVIYIAPTEEITARERLELEARRQVVELVPLRSEIIQVNYAKAEDIATVIRTRAASGTTDQQAAAALLTSRGSISVDPRTNSLLVQEVPEKLSELRALVARLDRPVRQVMIDSRVVIASDDFSKELGVRYGFAGVRQSGNTFMTGTGSATGNNTVINSAIANMQSTGQPFPTAVPSLNDRLGVNLGTFSEPTTRLALAILGQDYLLDLELSALQAEGRGEILSNPRVITTDRYQARVLQGREIPFQERSEGEVTVSFKEAFLEMSVVPQITPDNRIIMDLVVKKDDVGELVPTGTGGFEPSIDRREVETQVLVSNGETVVLGGVFEQISRDNLDKVPFLGDLPAIGRLFRRTVNQNRKLELLIFVTPQIVGDDFAQR